ncbi:hypothetical protein GRO15_009000, partial [Campylobacter jejuni]|nr:hypothetical protein [Campylobacter jejuni]
PAEGSLPSEGPLGPTSHPCLFTSLLRRARLNWPPGGSRPRARARRRHPRTLPEDCRLSENIN